MGAVDELRGTFPDPARDIKLNVEAVLQPGLLSAAQRWGVAVATAIAARNPQLRDAVIADARKEVDEAVIDDAMAAAVLMAMNNIYYRFRHMSGKPAYQEKPARLRMQRIAKPATNKTDFELFCLAVSAVNGCEQCIQSHERVVLQGGVTEDQVNDAIRIASTMHAAAVAMELGVASASAIA